MNQFQTLKSDLTQSRIIDIDSPAIDNGEIAVRIESYAFTANNVTYGVAGDTIGYWKFFPAGLDENNEWGCIPMWGICRNYSLKNQRFESWRTNLWLFSSCRLINFKPN